MARDNLNAPPSRVIRRSSPPCKRAIVITDHVVLKFLLAARVNKHARLALLVHAPVG